MLHLVCQVTTPTFNPGAKCLVQYLWDSKIRGERTFDRRFTRGGAESALV